MKCESCGKQLKHYEPVHGIKHGTIKSYPEEFHPTLDSAPTVICLSCGSMVLKLIYKKLNPSRSAQMKAW